MSVDNSAAAESPAPPVAARRLMRIVLKGSLATLDRDSGYPYASLVLVASEPDGSPVLLLSALARHTRNIEKDARASLLLDGTGDRDEALTGDRLTLMGEIRPNSSQIVRRRFLARHPSAAEYSGFGDFSFYSFAVSGGHFIGGFGRIHTLSASDLLTSTTGAEALIEAEQDIVEHMNGDHADAVGLYATELEGLPAGAWRMVGIDPDGTDLLHRTTTARVAFPRPILSPGDARKVLVELVQQARTRQVRGSVL